jgi:hypothetical protein
MPGFIPSDNDELRTWLTNLIDKVDLHGLTLGMTAAEITAFKAVLQGIIDDIDRVAADRNTWLGSAATLKTTKQTKLTKSGPVRSRINQWKGSGLLTGAMATDMDVVGTEDEFDPDTYKAAIKGEARVGFVRITFKKLGVDGLNIYERLKGQTTWKKLSFDSNSPYDDHTELVVAGTPEVREYRAIGVIDDEEIGLPSDIVSVTFAG